MSCACETAPFLNCNPTTGYCEDEQENPRPGGECGGTGSWMPFSRGRRCRVSPKDRVRGAAAANVRYRIKRITDNIEDEINEAVKDGVSRAEINARVSFSSSPPGTGLLDWRGPDKMKTLLRSLTEDERRLWPKLPNEDDVDHLVKMQPPHVVGTSSDNHNFFAKVGTVIELRRGARAGWSGHQYRFPPEVRKEMGWGEEVERGVSSGGARKKKNLHKSKKRKSRGRKSSRRKSRRRKSRRRKSGRK